MHHLLTADTKVNEVIKDLDISSAPFLESRHRQGLWSAKHSAAISARFGAGCGSTARGGDNSDTTDSDRPEFNAKQ